MRATDGFTLHRVFGTIVHQKNINAGETFSFTVQNAAPISQHDNKSMVTKGRVTVAQEDGTPVPVELFAQVKHHKPSNDTIVPLGTFVVTAHETSEWWCINAEANHLNRRAMRAESFSLPSGASTTFELGTKFLVCAGQIQIGDTVFSAGEALEITTVQKTAVALSDCFGFFFV